MSDDASDRLGLLFELTHCQKYQRGFAFCSIGLTGLTETTPIGAPVGRCRRDMSGILPLNGFWRLVSNRCCPKRPS